MQRVQYGPASCIRRSPYLWRLKPCSTGVGFSVHRDDPQVFRGVSRLRRLVDWLVLRTLDTARKGANIRKPALSRPAGHLSGQSSKEGGLMAPPDQHAAM